MKTCFNGVTARPEYEVPAYLEVIKVKDHQVVINPENGGWASLTEDELIQLFFPYKVLNDELFEKLHFAGLVKRNGGFLFEFNKVSHSPGKLYFYEFDLSNACNLNCIYCSNETTDGPIKQPDPGIGKIWIDRICEYVKENNLPIVTLEFTGGEPLVNIEFLTGVCEYALEKFGQLDIKPDILFASNMTVLGQKQIDYIKKFKPSIQVSLDGPKEIHDAQRSFHSGKGSFDVIIKNLETLKREGVPARTISSVITSRSVEHMPKIAQFILDMGYLQMTLQPMHCIGRAGREKELACDPDVYVEKLFETLDKVILPSWLKTKTHMHVRHLGIMFAYLLEPWRNYMCQRSPCGNSLTIISTDAKGDVYGCNQAPFNEETVLGNISNMSFSQCKESGNARKISERKIEKIEECRKCVFRSYCQGGCPKTALTIHGQFNKPGDTCGFNRALFTKGMEKLIENAYPLDLVRDLAMSYARR